MDISLAAFVSMLSAYPSLAVIIGLVLVVTVVSGATDAPNAIATAVGTRCMNPATALILAAVFNFIGLLVMSIFAPAVANTMFNMVDFSGNTHQALLALISAMVASIGWGIFCWFKGIPASKSHSLIAGITGAAIALNGMDGVHLGEWMKVIYGMVFSLVAGFVLGWLIVWGVEHLFARANRRKGNAVCTVIQNGLAMVLAFLHGGQDGQKFMAIALLGISLCMGQEGTGGAQFPLWLMIACSFAMAIGTMIGGKRIIKSVAMSMVKLEKYQGVASSLTTSITLLIASLTGMPVSTSHCNTSAIMGVAAHRDIKSVKWDVAGNMVKAWILTFPCCGIIGYVLAMIFMLF